MRIILSKPNVKSNRGIFFERHIHDGLKVASEFELITGII